MGYVYLIEDPIDNVYKIGVTRKNNRKRIEKLQTGNSHPLNVMYMYETEYPFRMESILHQRFNMYKVLNEWFELPQDIVANFKTICDDINSIIILMKDNHFFGKNLR